MSLEGFLGVAGTGAFAPREDQANLLETVRQLPSTPFPRPDDDFGSCRRFVDRLLFARGALPADGPRGRGGVFATLGLWTARC